MHFGFKYSKEEYVKAMRESYDDSKFIDLLVAVGLLSLGIYLSFTDSYELFSAIFIVISLVYIFMIFSKYFILPTIVYNREPKFKEDYELSFLENEILFKAGAMNSTIPWSYYFDYKQSKDFIFLKYAKERYTVIPKRIFKNDEEAKEFIDLLKIKMVK
ncbi:YcxB family protein [Paenibacillus sp. GCM10023252]|uniref:YcxB family protein n=1 Tax=Paenibacillus sp. GCM10023252 TaxID=3252649 RepID=UPI0036187872